MTALLSLIDSKKTGTMDRQKALDAALAQIVPAQPPQQVANDKGWGSQRAGNSNHWRGRQTQPAAIEPHRLGHGHA